MAELRAEAGKCTGHAAAAGRALSQTSFFNVRPVVLVPALVEGWMESLE